MDSNYLKYGSLITLSTSEGFFLNSEGYIDSHPILRDNSDLNLDYSSAVFRVIPKCIYSVQTSLVEYMKRISDVNIPDKLSHLIKIEENLEGEIRTNIHIFNLFDQQEVRYDSQIQLVHVKSHKFLTLKSQSSAESEKDNFKLSLEDFPSEHSHFRIVPSFKYQEHGSGRIKLSHKVYFQMLVPELRKIAWMHGSRAMLGEISDNEDQDLSFVYKSRTLEVNMSLDKKTRWILGFYGEMPNDDKMISCGDYIWLNIPEYNLNLTVTKPCEESEVSTTKKANDTNGLWMIQHEDPLSGGVITEDRRYRLKHISTGKFLAISGNICLTEKLNNKTLWRFVFFRDKNYIKSDEICYIINDRKNVSIKATETGNVQITEIMDEGCIFKPCKADGEFIWELLFMLNCFRNLDKFPKKIKDLVKAAENTKSFLKFRKYTESILRCLDDLKLFIQNELKTMIGMDTHFGEVQYMRQMMLRDQNFFQPLINILNCDLFDQFYLQMKEKCIKQDISKFKKNSLDPESIKIKTFIEILQSTYKLLNCICERNNENQKELFQYRDIFAKHMGLKVGSTKLLLNIIKNNEELILKLGNDPEGGLITYCSENIQKFTQRDREEFMKFLKGVCVFKGEAVSINQDLVFAGTINPKKKSRSISIQVHLNKDELTITNRDNTMFRLNSCFEEGRIVGYEKDIKFLASYLKLCANLVKGRNLETSEALIDRFEFKSINDLIWNQTFTIKIRACFCKLMLDLYIDCVLREEATKPNFIKIIRNNSPNYSKQISIISDRSEDRAYNLSQEEMPNLVLNIINYFSDSKRKMDNLLTYSLSKMVYKMIKFEIFRSSDDGGKYQEEFKLDKIIQLMVPLLSMIEHGNYYDKIGLGLQRKVTKNMSHLSNESRTSYLKYLSAISRDMNNNVNPLIRSSANLKKSLNSYKQSHSKYSTKKKISHKIKLKVCQILDYFLTLRQDYLLENMINWFKTSRNSISTDPDSTIDLKFLFPDIINPHYLEEPKLKTTINKFQKFKDPFMPDLETLSPGIITDLIYRFLLCKNYRLQTVFLELIFRNFRQRTEFLKNIEKLHVLGRYEDISLYFWLKDTVLILKQNCEKSELWFNYWNLREPHQSKQRTTFNMVIEILKNIKYFFHDDVYVNERVLSEPNSQTISKSRQKILYFFNVHTIIINLIKDGLYKLANIHNSSTFNEDRNNEPYQLLTLLFDSCFKVLKRFVYNDKKNQKKMYKYLPVITQYLYIPLGQIPLICEIFRENLTLINKITPEFVKVFEDLIVNYGRQAEFLKIFEVIPIVENKPIPSIQKLILSIFIKEDVNYYMMYMTKEKHAEFEYEEQQNSGRNFRDEPILYHSTLVLVLSKCGYGDSGKLLNEARCQNLISLKNIFDTLFLSEENYPLECLKIPMLIFFFNIYLDRGVFNSELKSNPYFLEYMNLVIHELNEKEMVDDEYAEFINLFIKIIAKYRSTYIKKIHHQYYDEKDVILLEKFCVAISNNSDKLTLVLSGQTIDSIFELCNLFEIQISIEEKNLDENRTSFNYFDYKRTGSVVENQAFKAEDITKWIHVRNILIFDKDLKVLLQEEDQAMVYIFKNAYKAQSESDFETIVKSLITFIRLSISQTCPTKTLISVIELIGKFIMNPTEDPKSKEKEMMKIQYKMSFYGLTNVVLTLMMDIHLEKSIFKALITLSTRLLEGGNYQIQQEFYQYFLTYSNSDQFFARISLFLDKKIKQVSQSQNKPASKRPNIKERKQFIRTLLRLLQLLCENHNRFLQNYLRHQEKSHTNYNMVTQVVELLHILMKQRASIYFPIISQCFETLTEFIQGPCFENQVAIVNTNFIEVAEELLSYNEYSETLKHFKGIRLNSTQTSTDDIDYDDNYYLSGWMVAHLKLKCLVTIISLFEGRKDNLVGTKIIRGMNLGIFEENIKAIYINRSDENMKYSTGFREFSYNYDIFNHFVKNDDYDFDHKQNPQDIDPNYFCSIIENGFMLYHIIKTLQDSNDPEHIETLTNELSILFEKIEENVGNRFKKGLTKTDKKREIKDSISRYRYIQYSSHNEFQNITRDAYEFFEKHTGNIEVVFCGEIFRIYFYLPPEYKGLTKEIQNEFHRKANRDSDQAKLKYMMDSVPEIIRKIKHEFFLKNLIKKNKIAHFISSNVDRFRQAAYILTILLNLTIMTSYKFNRNELSAYTITPDDDGLGVRATRIWMNILGISQLVFCIFIVLFFLAKAGPNLARKGWKIKRHYLLVLKKSKYSIAQILFKVIQVIRTILFVLSNIDVIYYLLYAVFSVLGTVLHPFYFSLLLLDVVYRNPSLQNVVNSIYLPRQALILTFVLLIVIVYIFTIFGYWMFEDYFNPNCRSLLQCLYTVWDYSFKYDGGIGGYLGTPSTPSYDPTRFFYDNIYNILVLIVLMGVVQGIIIDTFARLREDEELCRKDMKSKCFICGLERDYIEKNTIKGFIHHQENDHNIWNYILFICYLLSKKETEYSGIESYVREQYNKDDLAWIPNKSSLSIKEPKNSGNVKEIQRLESKLIGLEQDIKTIE